MAMKLIDSTEMGGLVEVDQQLLTAERFSSLEMGDDKSSSARGDLNPGHKVS
jgi:hypothetical protein